MLDIILRAVEIMGLAIMQVPFDFNTSSAEECKEALYSSIGKQIAIMMKNEHITIQEAIQLRDELLSLCNEQLEDSSEQQINSDTIKEPESNNTNTSIRLLVDDNHSTSCIEPLSYKDIAKDIIGDSVFDEKDADTFLSTNINEIDGYLKGGEPCDIDTEVINKVYASCYISYLIQKLDSGNKYRKDSAILVLSLFENFISNIHECYDSECFTNILQYSDKNSIKNANIEAIVNCTLISLYKIYLNLVIVE